MTGRRIPLASGYPTHDSGAPRFMISWGGMSAHIVNVDEIGHQPQRSVGEQPELMVRQVERGAGEVRAELTCSFYDRGG